MLEDALKTADLEDRLAVLDLNELITEALGLGDNEEKTPEGDNVHIQAAEHLEWRGSGCLGVQF